MLLRRGVALAAVLLAIAPLVVSHPSVRASSAALVGPKGYYLALGDSLAFGYQPGFDWYHGYNRDVLNYIVSHGDPTIQSANMGCVDETVTTFINGGCPFQWLTKYHYSGPQLAAALSFINQHSGQVSPVTLDIGANDFLAFFDVHTCQIITPTGGLDQAIAQFDTNYTSILSQLKAALNGTGDLFTMNYYFPYQNLCPNLLPLIEELNAHLVADAQSVGVPVADVFSAYGGANVPNPSLCAYTWACSHPLNIHPNDTGYRVIAQTFDALMR